MFIYLEIVRTDLVKPIEIWYSFKRLIYTNSKHGQEKQMWKNRYQYSPKWTLSIMK